jgi:cytoskeleton protein RodZ
VAQLLKLDVNKIAALEHDEVGHMVAPVYVAGYLRAYAKLLELPADEIVAEFEALNRMASPTIDPTISPAGQNYGKVSDGAVGEQLLGVPTWLLWGSVLVVVLLVVGFYGPWFKGDHSSDSRALAITPESESGLRAPPLPLMTTGGDKTDSDKMNGDMASEAVLPPITAPETETQRSVAPADDELSNPPADVSTATPQPQSELALYFNADSWVEVSDATGQRLVYRLGKTGMARTVQGVAPFEVQLGYVPGVDILYNGKPFDLSPYAGRRSARFRVGSAGDAMENNE